MKFADELLTGSCRAWKTFLQALIAENVPLLLVCSIRASDIVRDADILHLGVIRFLLGIGRRVWFKEIRDFLFNDQRSSPGPILAEWMGESLAKQEYVLRRVKLTRVN